MCLGAFFLENSQKWKRPNQKRKQIKRFANTEELFEIEEDRHELINTNLSISFQGVLSRKGIPLTSGDWQPSAFPSRQNPPRP